jgi:hypothetical protein
MIHQFDIPKGGGLMLHLMKQRKSWGIMPESVQVLPLHEAETHRNTEYSNLYVK